MRILTLFAALLLSAALALAGPFDETLKAEITNDPLGRGYAGMTDAQVAADLNTVNRDNWVPLSSSQIFESIDAAEFVALTPAQQARVDRILGLGSGIQTTPGSQARSELIAVFGGGSTTITTLASIANQQISRAQELGLGVVREGHVTEARLP